jgi:dUTP pyrophosphatase
VTEPGSADAGTTVEVLVHQLDPELPLPSYAHHGDAGADLVSAVDVELGPGERALLPTGIAIALPLGYAAFVHPRSGLAVRHGVTLVNAPGTIDAGYRGQLQVVLLNTDRSEAIRVRRGDRIGQLVIQRVEQAMFRPVDELPDSVRGSGGFGSTGGFGSAGAAADADAGKIGTADRTGNEGQVSPHATTDNLGGDGVPA